MVKLNLGCGKDIKPDYINVDFFEKSPHILNIDLSKFPWPFENNSVDEILMLDFLEHFPYRQTNNILIECFRVLKEDAYVDIQVPDFEQCARAACMDTEYEYWCNVCGNSSDYIESECSKCKTKKEDIADAAIKRLYGGQDREGNWHFTSFSKKLLEYKLKNIGFSNFEYLEKEHQSKNWNYKIRAYKTKDMW